MARWQKITALPTAMPGQKTLSFRRWHVGDPLVRDAMGIASPRAEAEEVNPQLILVPLLAFDGQGNRLGYGGGFYDTTLSHIRQQEAAPLIVGVAHSFQEVSAIPTEPHDVGLDAILTELGVSFFTYPPSYVGVAP